MSARRTSIAGTVRLTDTNGDGTEPTNALLHVPALVGQSEIRASPRPSRRHGTAVGDFLAMCSADYTPVWEEGASATESGDFEDSVTFTTTDATPTKWPAATARRTAR